MTFGEKLCELLEEKGISQKEFAYELNIAPSTLNGYIKNKRQPDFETLKAIAFILNVTVDFLLDYNNGGAVLTVKELSLISKIRRLENSQKEIIFDLVNVMVKRSAN